MKILLIDDEADARKLLREYLGAFPELAIAGECTNGLEAVSAIDRLEPDLIFLDIQMPGLSGFQVLQQIVHVPQVIFSTAYDRYALKAFDHNAIDYLLKPYTRDRFVQAISKVLRSHPSRNLDQVRALSEHLQREFAPANYPDRLLVEQGRHLVALPLNQIIWLQADDDYTRLHTRERFYLSSLGIGELELRLHPAQFLRIHRSAIINLEHIREVIKDPNGPIVVLSNGVRQKVSRSYQDALKRWMV